MGKKLMIAVKAWSHDKRACMVLFIHVVLSTIVSVVGTRVTVMISETIMNPSAKALITLIGISMGLSIINFIVGKLKRWNWAQLYTRLCNNFADKVIDADVDMFTKYSCTAINNASGFIGQPGGIGNTLTHIINALIKIVAILISIYFIAGGVLVPVIVVYMIAAYVIVLLSKKFDETDKEFASIRKDRNQEIDNIIFGFAEVRSFNTSEQHRQSIRQKNAKCLKLISKRATISSGISGVFDIVGDIGLLIIIVYSVKAIASGTLMQAQAMSLVMLVFDMMGPMDTIINCVDTLSESLALAEEYDKVMSYENKVKMDGDIEFDEFTDEIKLNDLTFSYDSVTNTLNRLNMTFKKGQKIGICGVSGGGKSTMFKLINRFYDPTGGNITVDGVDIRDITIDSYRKHLGSVHQENSIFPGTVMENVKYGNPDVSDYEVYEACKKANIYNFIIGLPDKFDTTVGPRGLKLSGGQKQRIALARLFLTNPDIILLDEATSALDNESETFIQDAIDNLKDKTIITIAHRLSTIRNSDIIYVIGSSGVLESGTHDELMAKHGAYYQMNK